MNPVSVFLSYSHKDEALRNEFVEHLSALQRDKLITVWHDHRITGGDEWKGQIDTHLQTAQMVMLLISPGFMASDYCYDVELAVALKRRQDDGISVIPILLRPVDWKSAPFSGLQVLPRNGVPITQWQDRDAAFRDVATALREKIEAGSRAEGALPQPRSVGSGGTTAPVRSIMAWPIAVLAAILLTLAARVFFSYSTPDAPLNTVDSLLVFAVSLVVALGVTWLINRVRHRRVYPQQHF